MKPRVPSHLSTAAFLMNFPFTVDNRIHNNPLMDDRPEPYNYNLAFSQFLDLYWIVSSEAVVYLLPSEGDYQDQPYVANLGCYLPHIKDRDIILLANFTSDPRIGEDEVGRKFFTSMEYEVHQPPYHWEGEADLKYLRDNVYVSGYGIRTQEESHCWMRDNFEMDVISVKMTDPKLYHFDCVFFPLTTTKALVATDILEKSDLKKIEGVVEVVDVPSPYLYDGWTNCVRLGNKVLFAPARTEGSEAAFKDMISKQGFDPVPVYLWEFEKSGADLSCMMMHFNYLHLK